MLLVLVKWPITGRLEFYILPGYTRHQFTIMAIYFIDFEAFQYKDEAFVIKELCVLNVDRPLLPLYFMFGPVEPWHMLSTSARKQYRYQSKHIHGLEWSEGVSRYCRSCVLHHIKLAFPLCMAGIFYVMGKEKTEFLTGEFPDLNFVEYNITFNNLPLLPSNLVCYHREHGEHCAYRKCLRLCHHYVTLPF